MADETESKDDVVRQLARLNLSTREIAARTGVSQSTVVRTLKRINTGPMPVFTDVMTDDSPTDPMLPAITAYRRGPRRAGTGPGLTVVLIFVAMAVSTVAGAVALLAWRTHQAPVPPAPQIMVCVHYQHGNVNGLKGESATGCPGGWSLVQLPG